MAENIQPNSPESKFLDRQNGFREWLGLYICKEFLMHDDLIPFTESLYQYVLSVTGEGELTDYMLEQLEAYASRMGIPPRHLDELEWDLVKLYCDTVIDDGSIV